MTKIKNRGANDILIAVIDGLKGFAEAINSVFPEMQIQTCIVHLIRNSSAAGAQAAHAALQAFEDGPWGGRFAAITALWPRHWTHVIPFFAHPQEVRKMIYMTNAIESLNAKLRRSVRSRGHFPSDEAATKLIWLQFCRVLRQ
jgi:putative transposase